VTQLWRNGERLWSLGLLVCGTVSSSFLAGDASASPLFELAGDVGGQGGFQGRTVGGDASSTYFNPALLVDAEAGLTTGFFVLGTDINISYGARPGPQYNVPNLTSIPVSPGTGGASFVPIGTGYLQKGIPGMNGNSGFAARPRGEQGTGHQAYTYEMIGLVVKLFEDRLTLGVYGLIPNGNFTSLAEFYPDEREQYFSNSLHPELYGDRLTSVSFAFGAGFKISDQLSIGASATLSINANGETPVYVASATALQDLLIDSNIKVSAGLSPNVGISYKPTPAWRLTATAHSPSKLAINDDFAFTLSGGVTSGSKITFVHDYMPWQFAVGTSYDIIKEEHDSLSVAVTGVYALWSNYVDRTGETPDPAYGWYNTLSPTVGIRHQHDDVGLFLDGQYTPTPVPAQTGRSDYVDNDRVGADMGVDYKFTLFKTKMRVGAQFEAQRLIPRTQVKLATPNEPDGLDHYPSLVRDELPDNSSITTATMTTPGPAGAAGAGLQTNNPGWPGFGSEGWVLGGGVYLSVVP
jgi:long-chain fatty acid transport protein